MDMCVMTVDDDGNILDQPEETKGYYVVALTPTGPSCTFMRSPLHPLHAEAIGSVKMALARAFSLKSKQIIQPDSVVVFNVLEISEEVVASHLQNGAG